jgi:PAS domain S-box-containing protein
VVTADVSHRALLETMSQCVMLVDCEGEITYSNRACAELMNRTFEELLGSSVYELVPRGKRDALSALIDAVGKAGKSNQNGEVKTDTLSLLQKNGERVSVGVTARAFQQDGAYDRILLELGVRHRASYLQKISEQIPGVLYEVEDHGDDLQFTFVSDGYDAFAGPSGELSYPESMNHVHPDDRDHLSEVMFEAIQERRSFQAEYRYLRDDGSVVWARAESEPYQKSDGTYAWVGVIIDITELKEAQHSLEEALNEQETLLREVHHRVKNNMGIVSSMLKLERNAIDDPEVRGCIDECLHRIQSMALVHRMLHEGQQLDELNLRSYGTRLIDRIWDAYKPDEGEVTRTVSLCDEVISLDRAIPLGLILNELVSNALRHGVQERKEGVVRIVCDRVNNHFELTVLDNGTGLPDDFDPDTSGGLGLRIVQSLVRNNLQGELQMESGEEGTTVQVCFPG